MYLDQHVDKQAGVFFMRLQAEFASDRPRDHADESFLQSLEEDFTASCARQFGMDWTLHREASKTRMAIFVSKYNHCLYDLLGRYETGELHAEIPFILSNHEDCRPIAEQFGIPYFYIPVNKENKSEAEARQLSLLKEHDIDLVVLARYMQIIGPGLIGEFTNKIINIHHSFLPAFAGAKPYHAAFRRGVKIIGATSHYVTEDLDEGPIIAQDVSPVSHSHSIPDFIAKGRDLEKIVLARAVLLHLQHKTLVYDNRTVVFA